MDGRAFRFRPPEAELDPGLRWALARAFASGLDPSLEKLSPGGRAAALRWCRGLALSERIASRHPAERLAGELGDEVAEQLGTARDRLAARSLLLKRLLERAGAQATELGATAVVLKGMALLETGAAALGARPILDVDLLVEADRARELASALEAGGLRASGRDERHHLPPLADPRLGELELHVGLPGLSLEGARLTPAGLDRAGLVEPSPRIPGLLLPRPPLLVAHLVAHGLDQHGLSPTSYPVTRLVADLLDLAAATKRPLGDLVAEAEPLFRGSVSGREAGALVTLCERLGAGDDPAGGSGDSRALLSHSAAAASRPRYRRSLRRRAALRALRRGDWRKLRPAGREVG